MRCSDSGQEHGGGPERCQVSEATQAGRTAEGRSRTMRLYRPAMLLVVIAVAVFGLAYYRFVLPEGIAAVVNGREISASALDAAVERYRAALEAQYGPSVFDGEQGALELRKLRSRVLAELIRERVILHEAERAGIAPDDREVDEAVKSLQMRWGLSDRAFAGLVKERYGGMGDFRRAVAEQIAIDRFLGERIAPGIADPVARQAAVSKWVREAQARAAVRVAIAEQWSASGCACCAERGRGSGRDGASGAQQTAADATTPDARSAPAATDRLQAAEKEGLAYWQRTRGDGSVRAEAKDFGCHFEIDIVKNGTVIKTLRYQNNRITEM